MPYIFFIASVRSPVVFIPAWLSSDRGVTRKMLDPNSSNLD